MNYFQFSNKYNQIWSITFPSHLIPLKTHKKHKTQASSKQPTSGQFIDPGSFIPLDIFNTSNLFDCFIRVFDYLMHGYIILEPIFSTSSKSLFLKCFLQNMSNSLPEFLNWNGHFWYIETIDWIEMKIGNIAHRNVQTSIRYNRCDGTKTWVGLV